LQVGGIDIDASTIYVIRKKNEERGGYDIGKFVASRKHAYIIRGNEEIYVREFEVSDSDSDLSSKAACNFFNFFKLLLATYTWESKDKVINALNVGINADGSHKFICRAIYQDYGYIPGQVAESNTCTIGYGMKTVQFAEDYQILNVYL
jgi:hypothetical protein